MLQPMSRPVGPRRAAPRRAIMVAACVLGLGALPGVSLASLGLSLVMSSASPDRRAAAALQRPHRSRHLGARPRRCPWRLTTPAPRSSVAFC